jgi:putative ABC transport system permease protein
MTGLYRLLLYLYPGHFRRRYAAELVAAFLEDRAEARLGGVAGTVRFCAHMAADLASSASRQRIRQVRAGILRRAGHGAPHLPHPSKRTEMDTLLQDVRYALRQFARRPGFTAIAVLSLAIGIGGNSLIYGLIDGFVLRPFPYPDPDRLVAVGLTFPKLSSDTTYVETMSPAEFADIRGSRAFSRAAAFDLGNRNISGGDVPERVFTALLLDDPLPVLGMPAALGRGFTREELGPGGARVAIISHRLWQSRFGGDSDILTRAIRIGGEAASIVGVMPRGLLLIGTDLWIPWGGDAAQMPRNVRQFTALARLAPGVTLQQANTELAAIAGAVDQAERGRFKEYEGWRLTATPWAAALLRDARPAAFMLLGAVTFVLLIACANLTNLFLARSTTRQRELAVRLALGAGRLRLARHLLTESLLLALAGAAAGLLLAYVGLKASAAVLPAQLAMLDLRAGINGRVLLWSLAAAAAAGLLVGVLPSFQATRTDPHESLKADGRAGAGRAGARVRQALVVAEIALSVVLLLGAGLLLRSFLNVQRVDPGFEPRGVLTMRLTLPRERYPGDATSAFFERLVERIAALPGVRAVSAASQFPSMGAFATQFTLERGQQPGVTLPEALITVATPSHLETLRVPLRAGRIFSPADRLDAPPVVLVNQSFAARYLPGSDPVGQRLAIGSPDRRRPYATIVGVMADYRNNGATRPIRPEIYMPVRQQTDWNQLFLLIRGDESAASLLPAVRGAVVALDPEQPVYAIQTLEESMGAASFQQRISTILLGVFAAVALLLAAVGIYGVMSYSVSARTQEMGVRLAVGAQRRDVMWLVLGQVLRLSALGLAIGIGLLLAGSRALTQLLFGVQPTDPLTIAVVAATLGASAVMAAWAPAFRASRVDPIVALRYE